MLPVLFSGLRLEIFCKRKQENNALSWNGPASDDIFLGGVMAAVAANRPQWSISGLLMLIVLALVVLCATAWWHEPLGWADNQGNTTPVVDAIGKTKEEAEEAAEELINGSVGQNPHDGLWPTNGRPGAKPAPQKDKRGGK